MEYYAPWAGYTLFNLLPWSKKRVPAIENVSIIAVVISILGNSKKTTKPRLLPRVERRNTPPPQKKKELRYFVALKIVVMCVTQ